MNSSLGTLVKKLSLEDSGERLCCNRLQVSQAQIYIHTPVQNFSTGSDLILPVSKQHASKFVPRCYSAKHAPDLLNLVKCPQSE